MKERVKSVDSLRGIAILAVLLIHTTTRTLEAAHFNIAGYSWTLFLNQIARFAVPLFFVLSGFVLELNYNEETTYWSYLKKRFSRIFIPYVFWSAVYYLFIYNQNHDNFVRVLLTGDASYQLYFIPALCIFYLLFPLFRRVYKLISEKVVLIVVLTSQVYLLYLDYYVEQFKLPDPLHIAALAYFFFVIGIVAAKNKGKILDFVKRWRYIFLALTVAAGFYVFWEGRSRYLSSGNYISYYSQWRPSTLVYTLLVGLTLYYLFENTKLGNSVISRFSRHSFLVFFIHVAVLETFWNFAGKRVFELMGNSPVGKTIFDPLFFGVVVFTSFLIAFVLHKISRIFQVIG